MSEFSMSLSKLSYDALNENFCYWYFKVYQKFPNKNAVYSRANLVKIIWILKRKYARIQKQVEVESFN